jgi:DNA-directed RNA polymerase specialized sigma24 family protein
MPGATVRAIEQVYRSRYKGYRLALSTLVDDPGAAHDVVQDAFAVALARRGSFRGGSLEAWIWRIAERRALDARRASGHTGELHAEASIGWVGDYLTADPDVGHAIQRLSRRRRLVVFLRYFADLSYAQIAEACDISEGTVAATLARAHSELAEALEVQGARR